MTQNWDPDFYKSGYEGFEAPDNFPDSHALDEYRHLLLSKTQLQVEFVARQLGRQRRRVIEFGSGNGRFLTALALAGMLEQGIGVEIARSRVRFAQRWAADLGLTNSVRHVAADALEFEDFKRGSFDLAVCITGAFGYFKPIDAGAPERVLGKMHDALASGGNLLLELYQMPEQRRKMLGLNGDKLRTWQPLPEQDRFAYYLDDLEYKREERILRHGKIFIGRNGVVDAGRTEVLAYYTEGELSNLLQHSFEDIQFYADFAGTSYREGQSPALVAWAARA